MDKVSNKKTLHQTAVNIHMFLHVHSPPCVKQYADLTHSLYHLPPCLSLTTFFPSSKACIASLYNSSCAGSAFPQVLLAIITSIWAGISSNTSAGTNLSDRIMS